MLLSPSGQEDEHIDGQMLELDAQHSGKNVSYPGVRMMVLALLLAFMVSSNKVFWHFGLHVSQRLVSTVGAIIWFCLFAIGARQFINARGVVQMVNPGHLLRVTLWLITVVFLIVVGILLKNRMSEIGKEAIILLSMGICLILGCDDLIWEKLEKPLIVMFYVALVLILWGRNITAVTTTYTGTEGGWAEFSENSRLMKTLAANLKPLLGAGVFLGAIGMVRPRTDFWRFMELMAIPASFTVYVGIFKFRSAIINLGFLLMMYLLVRPVLEGKMRFKLSAFLVFCCLLGATYFVTTEAFTVLMARLFIETKSEGIFDSRLHELSLFWKDMGLWWVPGRGIGGTFSTRGGAYGDAGYEWTTLHFGVLGLLLKGGIWMVVLFLSFIIPCLKMKPRQWYQNPYNMVAILMLPSLLLEFFFNPLSLAPPSIFFYLSSMFCLARFGRRDDLDCGYLNLYEEQQWEEQYE